MADGSKRLRDETPTGGMTRGSPTSSPFVHRRSSSQHHPRSSHSESSGSSRSQDRRHNPMGPTQRPGISKRSIPRDSDTIQFSWLFFDEVLRTKTPSRNNEVPFDVEMNDRDQGVSLIIAMAQYFNSTLTTQDSSSIISIISKASYLFHRFYMVHCLTDYHIHLIACCSLSLVLKLNGIYSQKVVLAYKDSLLKQSASNSHSGKPTLENATTEIESEITKAVYACELDVLKAVYFNVDIPSYPHRRVKEMFEKYFADKPCTTDFFPNVKRISVDCLRTPAVLIAPVDEIAVACFQLINDMEFSKELDDTIQHIIGSLGLNTKSIDFARRYIVSFFDHHKSYYSTKGI